MLFLLLSNPENRRSHFFLEALARQRFPTPKQLSWMEFLSGDADWEQLLDKVDCLRIESPGENFGVIKQLLALGANHSNFVAADRVSAEEALKIPEDFGRVQYLHQQHLGFELALEGLMNILHSYPKIRLMNSIESILLSFDKIRCHQHLMGLDVAMPEAIYGVENYNDLRANMQKKGWSRVFIKPNGGSSASGVLAYRVQGEKEQLISSLEMIFERGEWRYYNSLKVRKYEQSSDIQRIINYIVKESVLVEKWIPKAALPEGRVFDFRILVINGKAMHTVVRSSYSPMTNLHLGNQRGILDVVIETIGDENWQQLCQLAEKAVQAMPNMHYAGVDIMLSNNYKKAYLLEVNAFGDLLPNVFVNDMDSYTTELYHFFKHSKNL